MRTHIRTLAVLQIVYASIGLVVGLGVFMLFGGIAAIVSLNAPLEDTAVAVPVLGMIGTLAASFIVLLSLPRLAAGMGLLYYKEWARILTIIVSVLGLLEFPVGTALGAYGLWVTLNREGIAAFQTPPAEVARV